MITKNFEDYPEHRLKFFSLLRAIATHCFPALCQLSSEQLKLFMDSITRAFRHTERNIAETGLNLLLEMLKNVQVSKFCNEFHRTYFLTIEQEIFAVLTDTFHKPGFKMHVLVLQHLFCLLDSGSLTEPLWDASTVPYPYPNNSMFVCEYTIKLLSSSFPNMTATEIISCSLLMHFILVEIVELIGLGQLQFSFGKFVKEYEALDWQPQVETGHFLIFSSETSVDVID